MMIEFLANIILTAGFYIGGSGSFIEISQEEQLFLDDYVVDRIENRALIFGTALLDVIKLDS